MAFISVIIPTYNSGDTLEKCLQSLLNQTFPDFEVLIIDALSTDATLEKARNPIYQQMQLKVFSGLDTGVYDAMNKGIEAATGEWLIFVGSDDNLHDTEVFAKAQPYLNRQNAHLVYGDVSIHGDGSWAKEGAIYDGEFTSQRLFDRNICHQAIFYSREIFQHKNRFNTEYKICADWDFNLRCFARFRTQYIPLVICDFYAGGESSARMSDRFTERDIVFNIRRYFRKSFFDSDLKRFRYIFSNEVVESYRSKKIFRALGFAIIDTFHAEDRLQTLKFYIRQFLG